MLGAWHIYSVLLQGISPIFSCLYTTIFKHIFSDLYIFFFHKAHTQGVKITFENTEKEEKILDEGDGAVEDQDVAVVEEAVAKAEESEEDVGQVACDNAVVKSLHDITVWDIVRATAAAT